MGWEVIIFVPGDQCTVDLELNIAKVCSFIELRCYRPYNVSSSPIYPLMDNLVFGSEHAHSLVQTGHLVWRPLIVRPSTNIEEACVGPLKGSFVVRILN